MRKSQHEAVEVTMPPMHSMHDDEQLTAWFRILLFWQSLDPRLNPFGPLPFRIVEYPLVN